MAKGDHKRVENEINYQKPRIEAGNDQLMGTLYGANSGFANNFGAASGKNMGSYDEIMQGYRKLFDNAGGSGGSGSFGGASGGGWDPTFRGAVDKSISGYGNFADTGGFSQQDLQDIRARGIAPSRAVYQQAVNELNRSRNLNGGGTNYAAAATKMARDNAIAIGDANVNNNAQIAQMVQQGKLAGLSGLSGTGLSAQQIQNAIDQLNSSAGASNASMNAQMQMGALRGMTDLYGTTPGLINTTGNQYLQSNNQLLSGNAQQNASGMDMINARLSNSQVPGNFQSVMGNIGSVVDLGGRIVGSMAGLGAPGATGFGNPAASLASSTGGGYLRNIRYPGGY